MSIPGTSWSRWKSQVSTPEHARTRDWRAGQISVEVVSGDVRNAGQLMLTRPRRIYEDVWMAVRGAVRVFGNAIMRAARMGRRPVMASTAISVLAEEGTKTSGARRGAERGVEHGGGENHHHQLHGCARPHHESKWIICSADLVRQTSSVDVTHTPHPTPIPERRKEKRLTP